MTCAEMYEQMLEADLSELRLAGESPLAQHLRDCARCRSIATRLKRDTALLATAVARRSPRRTSTGRRYAVLAVAASLAVVLARWPRADEVHEHISLRGAVVVAPDTTPAEVRGTASPGSLPVAMPGASVAARHQGKRELTAHPSAAPAGEVVASPVRAQRIPAAVPERPRSVAALRLQGTPPASLGTTVSVDPADGKRATIIRTTNPAITVVWLQE